MAVPSLACEFFGKNQCFLGKQLGGIVDSLPRLLSWIGSSNDWLRCVSTSSYFSRACGSISSSDEKNISALIRSLADHNYAHILRKKREIEKLTDRIRHIHPLNLIEYIYQTPSLKRRIPKILDDSLGYKRTGFLNGYKHRKGLAKRMDEQMDAQNVLQFLPEFTESLQISEHSILPFFYSRDWEGLLRYLLVVCP